MEIAKLEKALGMMEKQLNGGPYFKGSLLSKVDMAWLPILHRAYIVEKHVGYNFLARFSNVKKWQTALLKTRLVEKSVSEDFLDFFKDAYFSSRTYLKESKDFDGVSEGYIKGSCC